MKAGSSRPVRLLMGIPFPGRAGGPPTHLPFLVEYFENHPGFTIRTFYYGGASDRKGTAFNRIIHTFTTWCRFLFLVAVFRPDIVHLNTAFDSRTILRDFPFSLTCFILRKKLFLKFHGSLPEMISTTHPAWRFLNRVIFLGASRVGVLSEPEREEFVSHYGPPEKFVVVRNIVSARPSKATGLPAYTREEGTVAALYAGRIISEKGLTDVIHALPRILNMTGNFILVVAGDGPDLAEAQALAGELKVNHAVRWLGQLSSDELNHLFPETDFLIFASRLPEGMPMTIFDAMKNGLPVITTPVRFAKEYFREPGNCLFISAGNPDSLASAVEKMIRDADLRMNMIKLNLELVREFSAERVGAGFVSAYRSMLNKPGAH